VCSAHGQGRPQGLFITPQSNRAVIPLVRFSAGAPDAPVLTHRTRSTASGALPTSACPPNSNSSVRSTNGHCVPTVKRPTGRAVANHRTRRCAQHPRPRRQHRTRCCEPPDAPVRTTPAPAKTTPNALLATTGRHSTRVRCESSKLPRPPDASDGVTPDAHRVRRPRFPQGARPDAPVPWVTGRAGAKP
jgi:hypothetical protein